MSDWDAVKKASEEAAEQRRQEERQQQQWRLQESEERRAAELALEQRIDRFIRDLSGNLYASQGWLNGWLVIAIGKKPLNVAGPDAVVEIRVNGRSRYCFKHPPMGVSDNNFKLPELMDQLVELAAEVVASSTAGNQAPISGTNYVQYLERRATAEKRDEWLSKAYSAVANVVGVVAFFVCWFVLERIFGLGGLLLGWLPAIFVGMIVGWMWGLILLLGLAYVLSQ